MSIGEEALDDICRAESCDDWPDERQEQLLRDRRALNPQKRKKETMNQITPIAQASAAAEESPSSDLEIFDRRYKPADLFVPGAFDPVLEHIRKEVTSEIYDATTKEGRERIKSQAFKVTKTKTAIDAARKSLVTAEKQRLAKIDAEGKKMWDALEALADEVKKPATDFENREKERIATHEAAITALKALVDFPALSTPTAADLEQRLSTAQAFDATALEEFAALAATFRQDIITSLTAKLAERQKAEAEAAELAQLRAANELRRQQEREAEIARKAAEDAALAAAEAVARAERDTEQALALATQAESDRIAAAAQAEEGAKRRETEAAERERQRIADEQAREKAEEDRRAANFEHRRKINGEALAALKGIGILESDAKTIISAIATGLVPHIAIQY